MARSESDGVSRIKRNVDLRRTQKDIEFEAAAQRILSRRTRAATARRVKRKTFSFSSFAIKLVIMIGLVIAGIAVIYGIRDFAVYLGYFWIGDQ